MEATLQKIQALLDFADSLGVQPAQLLKDCDLNDEVLQCLTPIEANQKEVRLINEMLSKTRFESGMGMSLGLAYKARHLGIWGMNLYSYESLEQSIDFAIRHLALSGAFSHVSWFVHERRVTIRFSAPTYLTEVEQFLVERDLGAAIALIKEIVSGCNLHLSVQVRERPYQNDKIRHEIKEAIPGELCFQQNWYAIEFDQAFLSLKPALANPSTAQLIENICATLLDRMQGQKSTSGKISSHLQRNPGSIPTLDAIASALHTSERTLKRKLKYEGTTYRELLAAHMRDQAVSLLSKTQLSICEVSERVGFANVSSFTQAFTRWTGLNPSDYRKRHRFDS